MLPGIVSVRPLEDYKLEVLLTNGNAVILDFSKKIRTIRFKPLADRKLFECAETNGESIRWNDLVAISTAEVFRWMHSGACERQ